MLADRVGIIDHGQIVAAGHSRGAQGRDRPPERGGNPRRRRASSAQMKEVLARFGEARDRARPRRPPCGSRAATRSSPRWCARSTPTTIHVEHLQLHAPTLDDVFLAKTGRSLEGAADEPEVEHDAGRSRWPRDQVRSAASRCSSGRHCSRGARSCGRCASRRWSCPRSSSRCCCWRSTPAGSTRRRISPASRPTPTSTSRSAIAFVQGALFAANSAGTNMAQRHRDRLPQPPRAHAAAPALRC